jgi:hypothetical protein
MHLQLLLACFFSPGNKRHLVFFFFFCNSEVSSLLHHLYYYYDSFPWFVFVLSVRSQSLCCIHHPSITLFLLLFRSLQGIEGKQQLQGHKKQLQNKRNSAIKTDLQSQPSRTQQCETWRSSSRWKQRGPASLGWLRTSAAVPLSLQAFGSTRRSSHLSKRPNSVRRSFAHLELDLVSILGMILLLASRMSDPFRFAHVRMCPDCASKHRTQ